MKTIVKISDLEGLNQMNEIKFEGDKKRVLVGTIKVEGRNYVIASLLNESKEYKGALFLSTGAYLVKENGVIPCLHSITGYSFTNKSKLKETLNEHLSILEKSKEEWPK